MGIDDNTVREIVSRIVEVARPERIILFGSAATDQMTPDSDIDLLVVETTPTDLRQEQTRLRNALRGMGYPFDVVVMATERFEESKNVVGGLAHPADKYGRVIYEAA